MRGATLPAGVGRAGVRPGETARVRSPPSQGIALGLRAENMGTPRRRWSGARSRSRGAGRGDATNCRGRRSRWGWTGVSAGARACQAARRSKPTGAPSSGQGRVWP